MPSALARINSASFGRFKKQTAGQVKCLPPTLYYKLEALKNVSISSYLTIKQ